MEYTKDMVFNVHYDEVKHAICFKTKNKTSYFWSKLKKHKLVTASIFMAIIFIIIDSILIINFINILETL